MVRAAVATASMAAGEGRHGAGGFRVLGWGQAVAIDVGSSQGKASIDACRITPDVLAGDPLALLGVLPDSFRCFWRGQTLPVSPFRRPIPRGVVGETSLSLRGA